LGLASCGGAVIKYADRNFAYNIHYGTGEQPKDERTGRSFGAGPSRAADDASDRAYLTDLEEFVRKTADLSPFYHTLLLALTNSDTAQYNTISDFGQTLLTDFLAVYTAEQDRNLMKLVAPKRQQSSLRPYWDAALLEVTFLATFHAGQEQIELFFEDPNDDIKEYKFTDTVVEQGPGGSRRTKTRKALLMDYWQYSSNPDPENRNRSGINITKKGFRKLGKLISDYERKNNNQLIANIERHFPTTVQKNGNVFEELSLFLINSETKKNLGQTANALADDFTTFLAQVRKDAHQISTKLRAKN
jgi:hypothetical protein